MSLEDADLGPYAALIGYRLVEWRRDEAVVTLTLREDHVNRSGGIHGGLIATLVDTTCGFAGCYHAPGEARRRALTLALHTQFVGAAQPGAVLTARAVRSGGGRRVFFTRCEIHDEAGRLIAQGEGTFRYLST